MEFDLTDFAQEYHQRVLKGLAPAAEPVGEDEEGENEEGSEDQATVLPDGTIDVTPRKKPVRAEQLFPM